MSRGFGSQISFALTFLLFPHTRSYYFPSLGQSVQLGLGRGRCARAGETLVAKEDHVTMAVDSTGMGLMVAEDLQRQRLKGELSGSV